MPRPHIPAQIFLAGQHPIEYFTYTTGFREVFEDIDENLHAIQ
jgi:hypothetical protein